MAQVQWATHHRANRLLAALEPNDLAYLEPHLDIVSLKRGQVLYEPGERLRYTYFPHDAMVSLVTIMSDGKSAEMALFGREGLFGLVGAYITPQAFGRYIVQVDGTASRVGIAQVQEAVATRPSVQGLLLRYSEALLAQTLQSVACNATHGVEIRCCRWLLTTQDRVGRDELPLTHEFLAEMLGVQRSTVTEVTRTLQTRGLIRQTRGMITVLSRPRLEETACECYGVIRRRYEQLLPKTYMGDELPQQLNGRNNDWPA